MQKFANEIDKHNPLCERKGDVIAYVLAKRFTEY